MHTIRFAPLVFILVALIPRPANAQGDLSFEPYTVYVVEENMHARCGPSDEYYRTDPLRHGQALEVYAETDDGWLGIRPPEDSFCWVQSEAIELDASGQSGTVIEDRTVAWIGTHLGRARSYRWQVQMAKGEEVTVIGKSEREGPDGPQRWYRVVPPSGEYRWVRREQVVDSSEKLVEAARLAQQKNTQQAKAKRSATLGDRYVERSSNTDSTSHAPTGSESQRREGRRSTTGLAVSDGPTALAPAPVPAAVPSSEPSDDWQTDDNRMAVENVPANSADAVVDQPNSLEPSHQSSARVEFIGRPKLLEIGGRPGAPQQTVAAGDGNWVTGTTARVATNANTIDNSLGEPVASAALSAPIAQVAGQLPIVPQTLRTTSTHSSQPWKIIPAERIAQIEAETRNVDVERLDLIFSRLMATQATSVEIEPIARAAIQLSTGAVDPTTAGRARMLLERTEQYRRLADRRDGQSVVGQAGSLDIPQPFGDVPINVAAANVVPEGNNEATYTGYLVQVYSSRSNSPPFALTDNTGRTIAYVTPTPGTNLRAHLNSEIQVVGTPGHATGLNTPHVIAAAVSRSVE